VDERYAEAVLRLVEDVPPGRVTSYSAVATVLRDVLGTGGPRTVARVMSDRGAAVAWWRVVSAAGRLPPRHAVAARAALVAEGVSGVDALFVRPPVPWHEWRPDVIAGLADDLGC
jgi:alkylated DNA nucleotide flippase Atl1